MTRFHYDFTAINKRFDPKHRNNENTLEEMMYLSKKAKVARSFIEHNGLSLFLRIIWMASAKRVRKLIPERKRNNIIFFILPTKGLGDYIIFSGLFNTLKNSGYRIGLICNPSYVNFLSNQSFIEWVVPYSDSLNRKSISRLIKDRVYLAIDLYGDNLRTPQRLRSLFAINPNFSTCFNGNGISRACFDETVEYSCTDKHLTDRGNILLKKLKINETCLKYSIEIPKDDKQKARIFVDSINNGILCLCPFASNFNRSLPDDKTVEIAEELSKASGLDVVIMGSRDQLSGLELSSSKVHKLPDVSIFTAMSVVGMAHFIVSVDTSFAHISNFFDKQGLFIYNQEMWDNFSIRIVFGANYGNANYIVSPTYAVRDLTPQQIISAAIPLIGGI